MIDNMDYGIYAIKNNINNKLYIGSAFNDFNGRNRMHLSTLRRNIHHNKHLQRAWNKYGEDSFSFIILEKLCIENIAYIYEIETAWIRFYDSTNPKKGYNALSIGESRLGFKHTEESKRKISKANSGKNNHWFKKGYLLKGDKNPFYGKKHKEDFIKKLSNDRIGINNPFYGKKHNKKSIEKMSEENHSRSKLNLEQCKEIKLLLDYKELSIKEISNKYNVSYSVVSKIKNNRHWSCKYFIG